MRLTEIGLMSARRTFASTFVWRILFHKSSHLPFTGHLSRRRQRLAPRSVLQQLCVHLVAGQLHVAHHRAADEAVLHRQHVRILLRIGDADVGQLDVQVLVDGVQGAADAVHRRGKPIERIKAVLRVMSLVDPAGVL